MGGASLLASDRAALATGPGPACSGSADIKGSMGLVAFSRRPSSAAKTGSSSTETPLPGVLAADNRCEGVTESVPVTFAVRASSPWVAAEDADPSAAGVVEEAGTGTTTAESATSRAAVAGTTGTGVAPVRVAAAFAVPEDAAGLTNRRTGTVGESRFAIEAVSDGSPGSISMELPPPAIGVTALERRWWPDAGPT